VHSKGEDWKGVFLCGVKRIHLNALKKKIDTQGATIDHCAGGRSRRYERLTEGAI
jgi:hypothetical protein